jgi:3-oxoacyl-[acyl-carrier-protein] synthase-3
MEATRKQLAVAPERLVSTVAGFGNSSAATIPFTWSHEASSMALAPGQRLLLTAAGAGLTGGSVVWGV